MQLPEKAEIIQRFETGHRRLRAAVAFSGLLAELIGDEDTRSLADKARLTLTDLERGREGIERYAGRRALNQVREAEIRTTVLLARLADRERDLSPAKLRRRLRRRPVRSPRKVAGLLGFYLHLEQGERWRPDRVDKVDLLITRLSQSLADSAAKPGSQALQQVLATLHPTGYATITAIERRTFESNLAAITAEFEAADSVSAVIDGGTLKKYRRFKHRLGSLLLHPDLLHGIITTNQALQRKIRRLSSRTLTGIFSIYQGIFETGLKGRLDPELRREIDHIHLEFDEFEERVKHEEVRLSELDEFLDTLTRLSQRLDEATVAGPEPATETASTPRGFAVETDADDDWLTEDVMALLDLLGENDRKRWPAELVSTSPDQGFQLDPREIIAFRRLKDRKTVDRPFELFLLKAAALRRSIKKSARKLAGVKDMEISRELPEFGRAQQAVQLAERFLGRYSQTVGQAILDGDVAEARQLQILRMRLVRESAGVWLQVHQPDDAS